MYETDSFEPESNLDPVAQRHRYRCRRIRQLEALIAQVEREAKTSQGGVVLARLRKDLERQRTLENAPSASNSLLQKAAPTPDRRRWPVLVERVLLKRCRS